MDLHDLVSRAPTGAPPPTVPVVMLLAPVPCAEGYEIDFRLLAADRDALQQAMDDNDGALPATVALERSCPVCGERHPFAFRLAPELRPRLAAWLGSEAEEQPDEDPGRFGLEPMREPDLFAWPGRDPVAPPTMESPRIEDPSERPVPRANRLYDEALELRHSDPDAACQRLDEAHRLYRQVGRTSEAAYTGITLAELLLDRDPARARDLLETAIADLTDPVHEPKLSKARTLLDRLPKP